MTLSFGNRTIHVQFVGSLPTNLKQDWLLITTIRPGKSAVYSVPTVITASLGGIVILLSSLMLLVT